MVSWSAHPLSRSCPSQYLSSQSHPQCVKWDKSQVLWVGHILSMSLPIVPFSRTGQTISCPVSRCSLIVWNRTWHGLSGPVCLSGPVSKYSLIFRNGTDHILPIITNILRNRTDHILCIVSKYSVTLRNRTDHVLPSVKWNTDVSCFHCSFTQWNWTDYILPQYFVTAVTMNETGQTTSSQLFLTAAAAGEMFKWGRLHPTATSLNVVSLSARNGTSEQAVKTVDDRDWAQLLSASENTNAEPKHCIRLQTFLKNPLQSQRAWWWGLLMRHYWWGWLNTTWRLQGPGQHASTHSLDGAEWALGLAGRGLGSGQVILVVDDLCLDHPLLLLHVWLGQLDVQDVCCHTLETQVDLQPPWSW